MVIPVWGRVEGVVEGRSGPDVAFPGECLAGEDARERDGLGWGWEVERGRVDAEPFEGVAERDAVAEGDHDGDIAGGVGVLREAEAPEQAVEFASESGRSQGRGAS